MNSRHVSLLELLAQDGKARFVIPHAHWQRRYVWSATGSGGREVEKLWEDLLIDCDEGRKHFCGEMLFHKLPGTDVVNWEVIDGQQRLITFFLLLIALRDVCERRGVDCTDLNRLLSTNEFGECRLILLGKENQDRHVLSVLMQRLGATLDEKIQDVSTVYRAYRYFVAQVEQEIPYGSQEFLVSILTGVDLLIQTVDPADNPWRTVEVPHVTKESAQPAGVLSSVDIDWPRILRRVAAATLGLILVALLCFGIALWHWDYARVKTADYREIVSRHGVPEGVVKLSDDELQHPAVSYRTESSRGKIQRVTEINGSGYPMEDPERHHASTQEIHYRENGSLDFIAYLNPNGSEVFRETYNDLPDSATGGKRRDIGFKIQGQNASGGRGHNFYISSSAGMENNVTVKSGISGAIVEYAADGRVAQIQYRDSNGGPRSNEDGILSRSFEYDQVGRVTKTSNLGADGQPAADKYGVTASVRSYDDLGNPIEVAYFGVDGQPVLNKGGVAKAVFKYDERGNRIEVAYFGIEGKPVLDKESIAKWTAKYDDRCNLIDQSYFGIDDNPVLNQDGCAEESLEYDERGNAVETACLGRDGKPMRNKDGYATQTLKYDERDNIIETAYFDTEGKPVLNKNGYAKTVFKYDERDNKIEEDSFDIEGKPMLGKDGFAKETFKYDDRGNVVQQFCFGIDGKPVLNKDGAAQLTAKYDDRGNVIETVCFGLNGQPVLDKNGLARETFKYDDRNNIVETACFGADGQPVPDRDGVARAVFKYDGRGNKIEIDYFDGTGKPVRGNDGFAKQTLKYDKHGNMIEGAYFGTDGQPELGSNGFAKETLKYDDHGRIIEGECFGINGLPIEIGGASRIVYTYDATGKISKTERFDASGQLVP